MWGHTFAFKNLILFQILPYLVILQGGDFIKVKDFEKSKKYYILFLEDEGKIKIHQERVESIIEDEIVKEKFENPLPVLTLKPFKEYPWVNVPYGSMISENARKNDINPLLLYCIMDVESNGNPYAVSKKGAEGLMQLMPSTAKRFGVKNTFNPEENLKGAIKFLLHLDEIFEKKLDFVLAGYICGENCVKKFGDVPNYREVQDYIRKILNKFEKLSKEKN